MASAGSWKAVLISLWCLRSLCLCSPFALLALHPPPALIPPLSHRCLLLFRRPLTLSMTIASFAQSELTAIYGAVAVQPQFGVAINHPHAAEQRDRLTFVLRTYPQALDTATNDQLLKLNLIMGGDTPAAVFTPETRAKMVRTLLNEAGSNNTFAGYDVSDPANPKWAGGAEGVADIVTALGPIVTLIVVIVQGEALNRTAVINLATGALSVWCVMLLLYFLAKVPNIFGTCAQDVDCWRGDNEKVFRNFILFLVSIFGIAFLLLQGTMVVIGFKTAFDAGTTTTE